MEDKTRYVLYVVVSGFVLGGLGTIFGNVLRSNEGSRIHIATFFLIGICIFLALFNYEPSKTVREIELAFLKRVRHAWIADLLNFEKGLPQGSLFAVGFSFEPKAVNGPARPGRLPNCLALGKPAIIRAFEDAGRFLLITGAAGSGKTVSLLQLAREMVSQAEEIPAAPLPVVLSLATWKGKDFESWLAKELHHSYDVGEDVARAWILGKRLLFLFDDLSNEQDSEEYLTQLNNFIRTAGSQGTAIVAQEAPQAAKLNLGTAIRLKKLNPDYAKSTLRSLGKNVTADYLAEIASSPLMLRIISVTPDEVLEEAKTWVGVDECRDRLRSKYIERQLDSAGSMNPPYASSRLPGWLSWLAKRSQYLSQPMFAIEDLQPSWLDVGLQRFVYVSVSRILGAFIVMALGISIMYLSEMMGQLVGSDGCNFRFIEVHTGLGRWFLITVILGGLTIGLLDYSRLTKGFHASANERLPSAWPLSLLVTNFMACFVVFLFSAWKSGFVMRTSLHAATAFAVAFALTYWNRERESSFTSDITTGHKLVWAGADIPKGLHWGLVGGYLGGLVFLTFALVENSVPFPSKQYLVHICSLPAFVGGLIYGWFRSKEGRDSYAPTTIINSALEGGLSLMAYVGVVAALVGWGVWGLPDGPKVLGLSCLLGALSGLVVRGLKKVSIVESRTPYQGLKTSLRTTILLWLSVGVPAVALIWGYSARFICPKGAFKEALFFGMLLGLLFGFSYGGLDLVYRLVLRLILWNRGKAPVLEYAAALDDAANLGLLRKIGHAYSFYHETIRDYFKEYDASR
ncbi:MAG: hypothetical protein QOF62_942 [Pyrinomonadaceae bacterium]|jgi:hypothetical protein|nr:hypothetical protein [Pyrinomonadaceae bacterium]